MVLLGRGPSCPLSHRHKIGAGPGEIEDRAGCEVVIKHDVRLTQPCSAFEREKLGIAGSSGDEGDKTAHRSSAIRWKNVPVAWPRQEPVSAMTEPVASCTTASAVSGCARIVE